MNDSDRDREIARFPVFNGLLFLIRRILFNLLYHQFAWAYDLIAWLVSIGTWQKWVLSIQSNLRGPKILEIGFGTGHLLEALVKKELLVFGMDESRQMVGLAHRRLKRNGMLPGLIRGKAQTLPFLSAIFDQVVTTFPSEYLLSPAAISEIHRVLKCGGEAFVLPLAWITGQKSYERLAAWVNRMTGEAPQWDARILEPLKQPGFETSWEMIDFANSEIVLVHMRKK